MPFQGRDRAWMYIPGRMTSRTPGLVSAFAQVIDKRLSHDGTAGVACADDQHLRAFAEHYLQQPVDSCVNNFDSGFGSDGSQQAEFAFAGWVEKISTSSIVR